VIAEVSSGDLVVAVDERGGNVIRLSNPELDRPALTPRTNSEQQLSSQSAVCVVGAGWRFTSGISYYTCRLANALADSHPVRVIQIRRMMPQCLYPGRSRVGQPRASMKFRDDVQVYDGVDWWWGYSLVGALVFMLRCRPRILVLQWWTATVLHTYLALALTARLVGTRVVLELHESQDTGEGRFKVIRTYGRYGLSLLMSICHGCVVHSQVEMKALEASTPRRLHITVAPHGPFDQYKNITAECSDNQNSVTAVMSAPRPEVVNLLFFGTIRPYKGLEDLLEAFSALSTEQVANLWLTVVGETWEGCTEPARLIAASPHRQRITFVNDYIADEVVGAAFSHADVVVLPYRRSSSSGPLHIAMSWGLPVVVTNVGGLPEAAADYDGAIFVPPNDSNSLRMAILQSVQIAGQRFADPRNWDDTIDAVLNAASPQ
jgi:glycosyltransferase involved in cell wall biosynthesis